MVPLFNQAPQTTNTVYVSSKGCSHNAKEPVMIGGFPVWLAAHAALDWETTKEMDLILPLNGSKPRAPFGAFLPMLSVELQDYGGVPSNWAEFIKMIAEYIKTNKKIVAYCVGSHGRTGCFAASLIALMEPEIEDPIAEIRKRHCHHAVESEKQAIAVFAIKGTPLPDKYKNIGYQHSSYSGSSWSNKSSNLYKITSVEEKDSFKIYRVAKHNTHSGSRIFFIGKKDSTYTVDQVVKLEE